MITREALHKRFTEDGVNFLKSCFEKALKLCSSNTRDNAFKGFKPFSRVCIWDSSGWHLPDSLKSKLRGNGGSSSDAGCKLQFCYDAKSSSIVHCNVTDGVTPDQSYSKLYITNEARENDLFIFDLGYYGVEVFSKIAKKGAFFLTRFIHNTELYVRNGKSLKRIDFVSYLQSKKAMKFLEQQVYIGKKQLKCRLLAIQLPEKEKNERIRKIKMLAKKRSLKISKERIFLASWNIFVTNAPTESLPSKLVWPFYRLRWSIELIFKQFKSTLNIHCWNHENYHRLMCEIYGKLITATIIMFTHSRLQQHLWKFKEEEISFEKLFKFFKNNAYLLMEIVLGGNKKIKLFQKLIRQATRHNKACLQKSRPTTRQIIQSLS